MRCELKGVIPAIVTPFTKGGKNVDLDRACKLAVRLADQGVHGIFPGGTTGEGLLMSVEERKQLLEALVGAVGRRVKVVAHTGCLDTATTVALTRHAQQAGAYAAAVVAPGFYGYDADALRAHYAAIAQAVPTFPVLLYNLPSCARNTLTPDLVIRLAQEFENIVGMKDSAGSMTAVNQVLAGVPKSFCLINGTDEYSLQALVAGAKGCVSSTCNVVPELFLGIYNNVLAGKLDKAWEFQKRLMGACRLFHYGAQVAYYKEGLRIRGFDPGHVRPPQRELSATARKALAADLKVAGLL